MLISSQGTTITVTFDTLLQPQDVIDTARYRFQSVGIGVPISALGIQPIYVSDESSPVSGVLITINKPTNGELYLLEVQGLRVESDGEPYNDSLEFLAASAPPQVLSAVQGEEGQIVVTFSEPMRVDGPLLSPTEYSLSGPSAVRIVSVETVAATKVMLNTVGMATGSYTLTVNATGTPHDVAGNPMDPLFNQVVFTGAPTLAARSIFTDKGPIAKPPLTVQFGATGSISSAVQVTLPTATILPSHVGLYITLTGTANAGTYLVTARVSATVIKVKASFTIPDAANGTIGWTLFDPRDGQIADDPSDVVVKVNNVVVPAESVSGLLGQVVLPTVPLATDQVTVDYSWIKNPVVDFRRLNSKEFRLNNWNQDQNRPHDMAGHKYRFNNTLIRPASYVALDLRSNLAQPLQRDLKYRAYERAYTAALNDPNLLLLNSPTHKIAFPPLQRPLASVFINYQGTVLPESDSTAPWVRHGTGSAVVDVSDLVVTDNLTGPFPTGSQVFWTRNIDLTYQNVFAVAWRMQLTSVPMLDGVFTGVAAGYSTDARAVVIGYLNDGGVKKIGVLKGGSGNDPSQLSAWTGGVDSLGDPTGNPAELDWNVIRSYRIFKDRSGAISVFVDGSVVSTLIVASDELPYLEELNAPFNELQGVFFGSLSNEAENESRWNFVRYTAIPLNPNQTAPSVYVTYDANTTPEQASQPWTPVGFHGTETLIDFNPLLPVPVVPGNTSLLLDSTSAGDASTGLVGGDFRGYFRIEPLLAKSFDTVLDINVALRTYTHGITPNAVMAAIDDGSRLMQLCFFPETASPRVSYGGRSLPEDFSPYLWQKLGGSSSTMVGQLLRIRDTSLADGAVYFYDDSMLPSSDDRIISYLSDYMMEFRAKVESYTPDLVGYCGVMTSVYDSLRAVGLQLTEVTGVRYVELHSDGIPVAGGDFAFDWFDGEFHTYRITKNTAGDAVSVFVDSVLLGTVPYSTFSVPAASNIGVASFGSATPLSNTSLSTVTWAYSNYWRVTPTNQVRKYVGLWKGHDSDSLIGYHLPLRLSGHGAFVSGNSLMDDSADFIAAGVLPGDKIVVDTGPNKGVYQVVSIVDGQHLTTSIATPFPGTGEVDYRVAYEVDWTSPHRYRMVKGPQGGVEVFIDSVDTPLLRSDYSVLDLPSSSAGVPFILASGLPSISWGAFDPANLSQSVWDFVHFGAVRSITEQGIVPHHQVLNQRNVMASYEHHRTNIVHSHTDFWSESEGIPPKKAPDLLADPSLTAYTLLNEGTPLVPSTQTYEVRKPSPVLVPLAALNDPSDVLNSADFVLNNGNRRVEILVPDDVLYNHLDVIERTTGDTSLIAPFDDESEPNYWPSSNPLSFQNTVCLGYNGSVLPENDTSAGSPWTRVSEVIQGIGSVTGNILTDLSATYQTRGAQSGDTVVFDFGSFKIDTVINETSLALITEPPASVAAAYQIIATRGSVYHQSATAFGGVLTYGTDSIGTRTVYRNPTPLPDAIGLQTEVTFRLRVQSDSTGGLGDSQIRMGFSSPGVTVGLAFVTTGLGERYVFAVDLNSGKTVGGIKFDFYDGAYHNYKLVRDPATASIRISIDS